MSRSHSHDETYRSGQSTPHSEYEEYYDTINQNPFSSAIVELANRLNYVCKSLLDKKVVKENVNLNKPIDIGDLVYQINENISSEKNDLENKINSVGKNIEKNIKDSKLKPTLLLQKYTPPSNFSPFDTLTDTNRSANAARLFPKDKSKFSGTGSPSLAEFLNNLELAQNCCKLSENEFKQRMLAGTTGSPHEFINNAIKMNYTLDSIYSLLEQLYDKSPSPAQAKQMLFNFKCPRSFSLNHAITQIQWLSSAAANSAVNPQLNQMSTNLSACEALIRCLPPTSSDTLDKLYKNYLIEFCGDKDSIPDYGVFVQYINPYKASIDRDIKANGVSNKDMYSNISLPEEMFKRELPRFLLNGENFQRIERDSGDFKPKRFKSSRTTYVISGSLPERQSRSTNKVYTVNSRVTNKAHQLTSEDRNKAHQIFYANNKPNYRNNNKGTYNRPRGFTSNSNGYNRNRSNNNFVLRNNNNRSINERMNQGKKYCLLCLGKNHLASSGCRFMLSPSGRRMLVIPSIGECTACKNRFQQSVHHPASTCPLKRNDEKYIAHMKSL